MLPINVEIWIASRLISKQKDSFTANDLKQVIKQEFDDTRVGLNPHITSYCVASTPANPGKYRYLTRIETGLYRIFREGDAVDPSKKDAPIAPPPDQIPENYRHLLTASQGAEPRKTTTHSEKKETKGAASLTLSQCEKLGFERSGNFKQIGGSVDYTIQQHSSENGCYLFVLDDRILYVGLTRNTLRNRIYQYCNPGPSQQTNIRVNELLKTELRDQPGIDIYYNPEEKIKRLVLNVEGYGVSVGMDVSLMERLMIKVIDPPWNRL
jgi:hypothetical protein